MAKAKKPNVKATMAYRDIRNDLLDQLRRNGTVGSYYTDLIDDYMDLWQTKRLLIIDINLRGVRVESFTARGDLNYKKNESVDLLVKVNGQMLKLLSELGIKPAQAGGEGDAL